MMRVFKSDEYNEKKVFLLFDKRKSTRFSKIIRCQYSSMCSLVGGKLYRFKINEETMIVEVLKNSRLAKLKKYYLFIDTGVPIEDVQGLFEFDVKKQKRGKLGISCVMSQKALLNSLGGKWRYQNKLDFIPQYYLSKRVKAT